MKKLIVLLMLFSCIIAYADDVIGKWRLSEVNWQDKIIVVGTITFQEGGAYTINHLNGSIYSNIWTEDGEYFTLAFHGFYMEWKNKNIFYLTPAFGESSGKKFIFTREKT